ncbi:MAG: exopolysaccharide biosynthesis polyprenyl glycosylphosphotransferase [Fusobacteria bacterium]|nr:exopolysaccharide biosynthesis polyprenyl glycosylphosphotransferase [Fusobacteriota bacterium]
MRISKKNKLDITFGFLTFISIILLTYYSELLITKGTFFILIISFLAYYIFDIFNLNMYKKINLILKSLIINLSLFTIMILKIGMKNKEIAIKIYLGIFVLHVIIVLILKKKNKQKENVLIIGSNNKNNMLDDFFSKSSHYNLIGYVTSVIENRDKEIGILKNIDRILLNNSIDLILMTSDDDISKEIIKKLLKAKINGIKVENFVDFYETVMEKISVKSVDERWFLYGDGFKIYHNIYIQKTKRLIDVFISIIILIITFPIILVSILIIKVESKGKIFYTQERIGKDNKKFNILKFRSMREDAEKDGPKWAMQNDNRITFYGNIMRKTRIDELPQLINILKGDMSFIGPRPERDHFIKLLEKEIPFYNYRHSVLPGLTGWAQVNYPYGSSVEDSFEKLQYDLYYIKNQSIILDIIIIFKTVKIVFGGKGR